MGKSKLKSSIFSGLTVALVLFSVLGNILTIAIPEDTAWEYRVDAPRSGKTYTYLYYMDEIWGDPHRDLWLDDIADSFDYVYIPCSWRPIHITNDSVDAGYLQNFTRVMNALGDRGCEIFIHSWYSSYHPEWLEEFVPELIGTETRWEGLKESDDNFPTLLATNLRYIGLLAQFFISEGVSNIIGWCLDDETSSDNWAPFIEGSKALLHSLFPGIKVTIMFNSPDRYWMAQYADVLSIDPYDSDAGVAAKIRYGWSQGFTNISVLLSGMDDFTPENYNRMRRQGWIAWFMGAEDIGWRCYNIYWHGYRAGVPNDRFVIPYNSSGPVQTPKSQAVKDFGGDLNLLKSVEALRLQALDLEDVVSANTLEAIQREAYGLARENLFDEAVQKLAEGLSI